MKKSDNIDEVMLGAFVDGELDTDNCKTIIEAMDEDDILRDRVYDLRKTKELMKLSFGDISTPKTSPVSFTKPLRSQCITRIAAVFTALAIGLSAGFTGYKYCTHEGYVPAQSSLAELAKTQGERIIVHIDESDPSKFETTLAYTEHFLNEHRESGKARIEVVANAGGIDLLREGYPLNDKVMRMMDEYDNVTFIACTNAINKLRAQGLDPTMIENVDTEKAVLTHIINRLRTGWTYVKADTKNLKI